jgi:hypothetical protein
MPTYHQGLLAVDAATGDVKWGAQYVNFDDREVALAEDGTLYGWEHEVTTNIRMWARDPSGTRLWMGSQDTSSSYASPPKIGFDGTIYGPAPNGLHAYDPDGTLKWLSPDYRYLSTRAPPPIDGQGNLYLNGGAGCVSLDPNGWLRWEKSYGCDSRMILGPDGNLYYTSNGTLYVRDATTGDLVRQATVANKLQAIGPDGNLYFGQSLILATDPEGIKIWEYTPPGGLAGEVLLTVDAADKVYASIWGGALALSNTGQLLWRFESSSLRNTLNQPVIGSDGSIYLMHYDYVTAITPEPATLSLLAVGLGAVMWMRKGRGTRLRRGLPDRQAGFGGQAPGRREKGTE